MHRADGAQQVFLLRFANDVHQRNAVLDADAVEHLPQIGCGRGVYQRLVAFQPHGLDHAQRGQRVDETRGTLGRRGAGRQHQALLGFDGTVLRVHGAAQNRHRLAQQGLRGLAGAGLDDRAGTLIADRHGLVHAAGHALHEFVGNGGRDHRAFARARRPGRAEVGSAEQQAEVRGIHRRGFDAHHHFVRPGLGNGNAGQRNLQLAAAFDKGTQLQGSACGGVGHDASCRAASKEAYAPSGGSER